MDIFRLLFIGFAVFCSEMLQKGSKSPKRSCRKKKDEIARLLGQSRVPAKKIGILAKTALWTHSGDILCTSASHGGSGMNFALARAEKYQESAKIAHLHRDSGPRRLRTLQGSPTTLSGASTTPPVLETRPLPPPNIPGTPDRAEIGRELPLTRGR